MMRQIIGDFQCIVLNTPRNICCVYLLESLQQGRSDSCPQHVFNERKKKSLLPIYYYMLGFYQRQILLRNKYCHFKEGPLYISLSFRINTLSIFSEYMFLPLIYQTLFTLSLTWIEMKAF